MGNYDVVAEIDARVLPLRTIHVALDRIAARPLSEAPLSERYTRVLDDPDAGLLYTSNKRVTLAACRRATERVRWIGHRALFESSAHAMRTDSRTPHFTPGRT